MSNRRKDEDRDDGEEDIPDVSGGALPPDDGYTLPLDGEVPYPRFPGAPIVRIDPPVIPD